MTHTTNDLYVDLGLFTSSFMAEYQGPNIVCEWTSLNVSRPSVALIAPYTAWRRQNRERGGGRTERGEEAEQREGRRQNRERGGGRTESHPRGKSIIHEWESSIQCHYSLLTRSARLGSAPPMNTLSLPMASTHWSQ